MAGIETMALKNSCGVVGVVEKKNEVSREWKIAQASYFGKLTSKNVHSTSLPTDFANNSTRTTPGERRQNNRKGARLNKNNSLTLLL